MNYKEIIEKRTIISVADNSATYYLGADQNSEAHINNEHDKIFRKISSLIVTIQK